MGLVNLWNYDGIHPHLSEYLTEALPYHKQKWLMRLHLGDASPAVTSHATSLIKQFSSWHDKHVIYHEHWIEKRKHLYDAYHFVTFIHFIFFEEVVCNYDKNKKWRNTSSVCV